MKRFVTRLLVATLLAGGLFTAQATGSFGTGAAQSIGVTTAAAKADDPLTFEVVSAILRAVMEIFWPGYGVSCATCDAYADTVAQDVINGDMDMDQALEAIAAFTAIMHGG